MSNFVFSFDISKTSNRLCNYFLWQNYLTKPHCPCHGTLVWPLHMLFWALHPWRQMLANFVLSFDI